ncbi:WG repeat-containing protein [Sphingobacterium alkalisoli]|uniref:WG repeat-containing protein n=1 Tax=Sphingobacterium alkalisoli TaxID=1874115 RepID=A0A4V5LYU8_9SPHI|nr:WG repeat-containing protein [Sphingobacterium alkalisoli]TJY67709.1 WG repeat-containing protein [Sphingobacterium alkalisoli]GGH11847.1 hypothetical protein GCM10011418_11000 [Sphingobacterium alkalisoli]
MKALTRIIGLLFLLPLIGCRQPKKQYGPDDYLYRVSDMHKDYQRSGYKDREGNIAIPIGKYKFCFTDTIKTIGFVAIPKQGFWAINKNDEKLFRVLPFDNAPDEIYHGLFRILNENDMIGFANMNGEVVIPPRYSLVKPFFDSITNFCDGCKTWRESKTLHESAHEGPRDLLKRLKDTVMLNRNVKYGAINIKGDTVLQPLYDRIGRFIDDIALVYRDGRAFYIDRFGNEVVYDPKKPPNQKPLDKNINSKIKYIDGWESPLH